MWGGGHDVAAVVPVAIVVLLPLHHQHCLFPPHELLLTAVVAVVVPWQ